jgi:hypothetical protein
LDGSVGGFSYVGKIDGIFNLIEGDLDGLVEDVGDFHVGAVFEELRRADICLRRVEVVKDVTGAGVLKAGIF